MAHLDVETLLEPLTPRQQLFEEFERETEPTEPQKIPKTQAILLAIGDILGGAGAGLRGQPPPQFLATERARRRGEAQQGDVQRRQDALLRLQIGLERVTRAEDLAEQLRREKVEADRLAEQLKREEEIRLESAKAQKDAVGAAVAAANLKHQRDVEKEERRRVQDALKEVRPIIRAILQGVPTDPGRPTTADEPGALERIEASDTPALIAEEALTNVIAELERFDLLGSSEGAAELEVARRELAEEVAARTRFILFELDLPERQREVLDRAVRELDIETIANFEAQRAAIEPTPSMRESPAELEVVGEALGIPAAGRFLLGEDRQPGFLERLGRLLTPVTP